MSYRKTQPTEYGLKICLNCVRYGFCYVQGIWTDEAREKHYCKIDSMEISCPESTYCDEFKTKYKDFDLNTRHQKLQKEYQTYVDDSERDKENFRIVILDQKYVIGRNIEQYENDVLKLQSEISNLKKEIIRLHLEDPLFKAQKEILHVENEELIKIISQHEIYKDKLDIKNKELQFRISQLDLDKDHLDYEVEKQHLLYQYWFRLFEESLKQIDQMKDCKNCKSHFKNKAGDSNCKLGHRRFWDCNPVIIKNKDNPWKYWELKQEELK